MNNSMKIGLVKITLFSILIALSGMAAIASADEEMPITNIFRGNATLNGADAPLETTITAYIDEELRGSCTVGSGGRYYIGVIGNESDGGKIVTFKICGATADRTVVWLVSYQSRPLDLIAWDNEPPAVTNANANPSSIVANGTDATQLNATVIDGCRCTVGDVTVDMSAIGGDAAQAMTRIGDTDVYSVPATADANTAPGAYCLYVNASDVFGNYNDSVCIDLVIKDIEAPVVSNPDANPESIVADGAQESRLNVTVVDDSDIDFVTVDLSAIGGSDAQVMEFSGGDVYSAVVTAAPGTPADAYCLQVNASDVSGNYDDTSVCIALEVMATGLPQTGDIDGIGDVNFDDAIYLARYTIFGEDNYPLHADGDVDSSGDVNFDDAVYLARYTIFGEDNYPLYP